MEKNVSRWCLACDAAWPSGQTFLAEVKAWRKQQPGKGPSRTERQSRFAALLARLDDTQVEELPSNLRGWVH